MYNHLALVKTIYHHTKVVSGEMPHVSDMDIIASQALLMDAGSVTFNAIKSGEIAEILAGLVALSYNALQAVAIHNQDIIEAPSEGYQEYQILAIMQLLSNKIHRCSSGAAKRYTELYHLCASLTSGFLNADFNKAFLVYHEWYKANQISNDETNHHKANLPDLTDCLYE
jgi:hypothetical protein